MKGLTLWQRVVLTARFLDWNRFSCFYLTTQANQSQTGFFGDLKVNARIQQTAGDIPNTGIFP